VFGGNEFFNISYKAQNKIKILDFAFEGLINN
jgi:hypothetical protein